MTLIICYRFVAIQEINEHISGGKVQHCHRSPDSQEPSLVMHTTLDTVSAHFLPCVHPAEVLSLLSQLC